MKTTITPATTNFAVALLTGNMVRHLDQYVGRLVSRTADGWLVVRAHEGDTHEFRADRCTVDN